MLAASLESRSSALLPPGRLALAPMDGVTDSAYRALWTSRGAPGRFSFCVSEFVRVSDRPIPASVIRRACPEVLQNGMTVAGVPVLVQLLGGDAGPIAQTAKNAIGSGAFGIDLNFGCPAKLVNRHDGGASLLRTPERIERIVAEVRKAVPMDRPVSVKIRLGWESSHEVVAIARAAERGGASWLTVHGRTKLEMYGPPADWQAIGRARSAVEIVVIANGDLNTEACIERCAVLSGCSYFMLGRGPMGRPSLLKAELSTSPASEVRLIAELLLQYLEFLDESGNSEARQVARVKQWLSLGTRVNPDLGPFFEIVKRTSARADLRRRLAACR